MRQDRLRHLLGLGVAACGPQKLHQLGLMGGLGGVVAAHRSHQAHRFGVVALPYRLTRPLLAQGQLMRAHLVEDGGAAQALLLDGLGGGLHGYGVNLRRPGGH